MEKFIYDYAVVFSIVKVSRCEYEVTLRVPNGKSFFDVGVMDTFDWYRCTHYEENESTLPVFKPGDEVVAEFVYITDASDESDEPAKAIVSRQHLTLHPWKS